MAALSGAPEVEEAVVVFHRSPRALTLWGAALVVAVVTATVVASDLAAIHRRASSLGPEVRAVVARRDLSTGTELSPGDVTTRLVHRSQLPSTPLLHEDGLHDPTSGRVVTVPVLRGGFVTERNLTPRRRTGLDGVLPVGSRAIRVDVAGALVPRVGAAVDVLASYSGAGESTGATVVVAAGALVLATDDDGTRGTGRSGAGVTLLVDIDEARDLADAQANGVLTIALVPPEEATRFSTGSGR
ncbi:MAG: SAF domain-containing protein [Acidimicrobiia bacterium]